MKNKIPLTQADSLASRILVALAPGCREIKVAGSVRRRESFVGDIEIVAVPEFEIVPLAQSSLFDDDERPCAFRSLLDVQIVRLLAEKPNFKRGDKNGEKFKNFQINDTIQLDLWITTRPQWGYIYALRTGSEAFVKRMVRLRTGGGMLPPEYHFDEGWLWYRGEKVATTSERVLFDVLGGWVEPEDRK